MTLPTLIGLITGSLAVVVCIIVLYYFRYKYRLSPGKALARAQADKAANSSIIATFLCHQAFWMASTLYISKDAIWCQQGDKVLFSVPIKEIVLVNYSYWTVRFTTQDGHKYNVGAMVDFGDQITSAFAYRYVAATSKATLDTFLAAVRSVGLNPMRKITFEKNFALTVACAIFGLTGFGLLLVWNLSR